MDPSCLYRTSVIWRIQMDRIELPSNSYPRLREAIKAIPRFSGLIVFGAGIGAERRQLLLRHCWKHQRFHSAATTKDEPRFSADNPCPLRGFLALEPYPLKAFRNFSFV